MVEGFESDEDLIGYCEIHCKTERALFSSDQIKEMFLLAGMPEEAEDVVPGFYHMHEEMEKLCKLARLRIALKEEKANNKCECFCHKLGQVALHIKPAVTSQGK